MTREAKEIKGRGRMRKEKERKRPKKNKRGKEKGIWNQDGSSQDRYLAACYFPVIVSSNCTDLGSLFLYSSPHILFSFESLFRISKINTISHFLNLHSLSSLLGSTLTWRPSKESHFSAISWFGRLSCASLLFHRTRWKASGLTDNKQEIHV